MKPYVTVQFVLPYETGLLIQEAAHKQKKAVSRFVRDVVIKELKVNL